MSNNGARWRQKSATNSRGTIELNGFGCIKIKEVIFVEEGIDGLHSIKEVIFR
jgi:hypothetical protein